MKKNNLEVDYERNRFYLRTVKRSDCHRQSYRLTEYAAEHVMNVYKEMGYAPVQTAKGGIFIDLGGKNEEDAILLTAHMDTLGAMVHIGQT